MTELEELRIAQKANSETMFKLIAKLRRQDAVLTMALEALDNEQYVSKYTHIVEAIDAIKELQHG
jgi:hypothetical protein